jgi:hypothetical protein
MKADIALFLAEASKPMEAVCSPVPTIDHRKVPEVHAPGFSQPVLKRRGLAALVERRKDQL